MADTKLWAFPTASCLHIDSPSPRNTVIQPLPRSKFQYKQWQSYDYPTAATLLHTYCGSKRLTLPGSWALEPDLIHGSRIRPNVKFLRIKKILHYKSPNLGFFPSLHGDGWKCDSSQSMHGWKPPLSFIWWGSKASLWRQSTSCIPKPSTPSSSFMRCSLQTHPKAVTCLGVASPATWYLCSTEYQVFGSSPLLVCRYYQAFVNQHFAWPKLLSYKLH